MKAVSLTALLLASLSLAACNNNSAPEPRDTLTVSGVGEVTAEPDQFKVIATLSEQGDDIAAMKAQVDQNVAALLSLADELKIEEKAVTASDLQVSPQWQYQPERKLIGHQVSRQVSLTVNGMDTYTALLDGMAKQGIKQIHPAGASVSNPQALEDQALKNAVADARRRARLLAEAAERQLGAAIQITAHDIGTPMPMMMARSEKAGMADSYRPGESQIRTQVQITFALN